VDYEKSPKGITAQNKGERIMDCTLLEMKIRRKDGCINTEHPTICPGFYVAIGESLTLLFEI